MVTIYWKRILLMYSTPSRVLTFVRMVLYCIVRSEAQQRQFKREGIFGCCNIRSQ